MSKAAGAGASAAGIVLMTLAAGQFLMTLDSSVMNVSIATVAEDVGTTVTGIQTAITLYTLVMASLMITGGKIGAILGRKRTFAIGCVIYGCGSFVTAIAPNLAVLMIGWSLLEGIGAALILPAIVALVASNFARAERPRAYGLVASAGRHRGRGRSAHRRPVHHLPVVALRVRRRGADRRWSSSCSRGAWPTPRRAGRRGSTSSAPCCRPSGSASIVFGILRAGVWGFVRPKPDAPEWLGLSPSIWLMLGGGVVLSAVPRLGEPPARPRRRAARRSGDPAQPGAARRADVVLLPVPPAGRLVLRRPALPVRVALGLSAIATGVRLLPLSVTLLLAAAGIPKVFPTASPRRVVQVGIIALLAGLVVMVRRPRSGRRTGDRDLADAARRPRHRRPRLPARCHHGVVGARRAEPARSAGLQNTVTNLGASIGTALAGAVLSRR